MRNALALASLLAVGSACTPNPDKVCLHVREIVPRWEIKISVAYRCPDTMTQMKATPKYAACAKCAMSASREEELLPCPCSWIVAGRPGTEGPSVVPQPINLDPAVFAPPPTTTLPRPADFDKK